MNYTVQWMCVCVWGRVGEVGHPDKDKCVRVAQLLSPEISVSTQRIHAD